MLGSWVPKRPIFPIRESTKYRYSLLNTGATGALEQGPQLSDGSYRHSGACSAPPLTFRIGMGTGYGTCTMICAAEACERNHG